MKVEVYWNLHRKQWSVRNCATGRVVAHVCSIALDKVQWVVRPAGREKVRREGKKNVHAFARGVVLDSSTYPHGWTRDNSWQDVTYNPYRDESFVRLSYDGQGVVRHPIDCSIAGLLTMSEGKPKVWAKLGD